MIEKEMPLIECKQNNEEDLEEKHPIKRSNSDKQLNVLEQQKPSKNLETPKPAGGGGRKRVINSISIYFKKKLLG